MLPVSNDELEQIYNIVRAEYDFFLLILAYYKLISISRIKMNNKIWKTN